MTEPNAEPDTDAETDTEAESEASEMKLSGEIPKRRIAVSVDGRSVEVEGPDDMLYLVTVAAELWRLTEPPAGQPVGFGGGATLYTQIAEHVDLADREEP